MFLVLLSLMKHISNLQLMIKRFKKYGGDNNMCKCKVQIYFLKKRTSISQAHQLLKEICTLKSPFFFQLFNFSSLDMGTCSNQSEWGRQFYDASAVQQATSSH